jgi:beta-xylosidase
MKQPDDGSPAPASALLTAAPPWLPDQNDGTYRNPVLFADYSDPDAIRVGEDYWLTSSSFGHVPGLPILHSRDLVNWTLVNHALPRLGPVDHFSTPRHGQGVWAPAIRFHQGKFWIFFPDPDFGLYVITADDPRGQWSDPVLIRAGKGLIDPCPFWDADGTGYLIHAWARSRSGIKNRLTLHRLRSDNLAVTDSGVVIIDGDQMPGWNTIEGPKIYRRGGYYYVFAPAGGVTDGYQAVFRSRSLYGPFENRIVLARGASNVNGPHQGAWVDTPEGTDWFLHFQELPAYGRVVHLQPVHWRDDWPVMGENPSAEGTGQPVRSAPLPRRLPAPPTGPATSDAFEGPTLGLQWQWQANPQPAWASLSARPGWLRLAAVPQPTEATLWTAPNLLLQKFPAPGFAASTLLELAPASAARAGLIVFGLSYRWIGLRHGEEGLRLVSCRCDDAHQGGTECEEFNLPAPAARLHLRVSVAAGAWCGFSYSVDGTSFSTLGELFQARSSCWVGAKVGIFAGSSAEVTPAGHADFARFCVTPPAP